MFQGMSTEEVPQIPVSVACSATGIWGTSSVDMPWNIHAQRALRLVALSLLVGSSGLRAQAPCPRAAAETVMAGWAAYRTDSLERASERFTQVLRNCPGNRDAQIGLGFTLL